MGHVIIINESEWPTAALAVLTEFCVSLEPELNDRIIRVWATQPDRRRLQLSGRAATEVGRISISMSRRYGRAGRSDRTVIDWSRGYKPSDPRVPENDDIWQVFPLRSRLELLVQLIAHELHHLTSDGSGDAPEFKGWNEDNQVAHVKLVQMERRCDLWSVVAVQRLRSEWPRLAREIRARARVDDKTQVAAKKAMAQCRDATSLGAAMRAFSRLQ